MNMTYDNSSKFKIVKTINDVFFIETPPIKLNSLQNQIKNNDGKFILTLDLDPNDENTKEFKNMLSSIHEYMVTLQLQSQLPKFTSKSKFTNIPRVNNEQSTLHISHVPNYSNDDEDTDNIECSDDDMNNDTDNVDDMNNVDNIDNVDYTDETYYDKEESDNYYARYNFF